MPIGAVLFDLDGVLVDSEPLWDRVIAEFLAEIGVPEPRFDPAYRSGLNAFVAEVVRAHGLATTPEQLRDEIWRRFAGRVDELAPMPGAQEAVRAVQQKLPTAIVSTTPRFIVEHVLANLGLRFPLMACGGEAASKPAPDPYLHAARLLKVPPAACLAVEDSRNGIVSAKAAGMWVIGFLASHNSLQDLAHADIVIRSLGELPALLTKQGGQ